MFLTAVYRGKGARGWASCRAGQPRCRRTWRRGCWGCWLWDPRRASTRTRAPVPATVIWQVVGLGLQLVHFELLVNGEALQVDGVLLLYKWPGWVFQVTTSDRDRGASGSSHVAVNRNVIPSGRDHVRSGRGFLTGGHGHRTTVRAVLQAACVTSQAACWDHPTLR